ncbi:MAG TPA: hypothetical protein VNO14_19005 [Blastocatellia bacterium]|nr:hypothetical protein [Blastocatellia bacterium]
MVTRKNAFSSLLLILLTSMLAQAGDGPFRLRPGFRPGDESRYLIKASVTTSVSPRGENGLSASLSKEVTATILLRTVAVGEQGEVSQEAIIEAVSSSAVKDGVETASNGDALAGKKIEFTFNSAGQLLKCSIPVQSAELGLADAVFALVRWFPLEGAAIGDTWKAPGQGPVYADRLSDIAKNSTTEYRLLEVDEDTALIEGTVTLSQSGASVIPAGRERLNVNVAASGGGKTRFSYNISSHRITGGATETRLEGRLANILPSEAGGKLLSREGALVETARFSIKLLP